VKNRPSGVITSIASPASASRSPHGKAPTQHPLDGDPQFAVVAAGADRVRAAEFRAIELRPEGEMLSLDEAILVDEAFGDLELEADAIRRLRRISAMRRL